MEPVDLFYTGSNISPNSIRLIAESIGIPNLDSSISNLISENVSYWLSILIQDAEKYSRHEKRTFLTVKDYSKALKNRNFEPFYGFSDPAFLPFRNAYSNSKEFFFQEENIPELDLAQTALSQLPKIPLDSSVKAHWLCIEGVQPITPENISTDQRVPSNPSANLNVPSSGTKTPKTHTTTSVPSSPDLAKRGHKHKRNRKWRHLAEDLPISMEQQLYYKDITEACVGSEELKRAQAFQSLATDPGLHSLLPRFASFVAQGVKINLLQRNLAVLIYLMRMIRALLENPHLLYSPSTTKTASKMASIAITSGDFLASQQLKHQAHSLIPAVLSCCLCDRICQRPEIDNHWALRDFSSKLLSQFCSRLDNSSNRLRARICKLCREIITKFLAEKNAKDDSTGGNKGSNANIVGGDFGTERIDDSRLEASSYFSIVSKAEVMAATLYGAISALHELGPLALIAILPRDRIKDLDMALTTHAQSIHAQITRTGHSIAPAQRVTAERVAVEHVKQLLVKVACIVHRYENASQMAFNTSGTNAPLSLTNTTPPNLEELKDQFGSSLAPLIFASLRKLPHSAASHVHSQSTSQSYINQIGSQGHRNQLIQSHQFLHVTRPPFDSKDSQFRHHNPLPNTHFSLANTNSLLHQHHLVSQNSSQVHQIVNPVRFSGNAQQTMQRPQLTYYPPPPTALQAKASPSPINTRSYSPSLNNSFHFSNVNRINNANFTSNAYAQQNRSPLLTNNINKIIRTPSFASSSSSNHQSTHSEYINSFIINNSSLNNVTNLNNIHNLTNNNNNSTNTFKHVNPKMSNDSNFGMSNHSSPHDNEVECLLQIEGINKGFNEGRKNDSLAAVPNQPNNKDH
ncbi:unnamed protein product [Gordionus sp. m RMFG-2023]